ncbi:chromosome segregation protein SMC [Paenibacillus sp. PK3_47]|uniref:AAA family ATPase n=1 Tax=Paenibacillus sp. PK3_47 TaxID=2072642 RepID=UPI00201E2193|nr:AAA family ATPase [Paenibacillus sp. PK3_47]UQZ34854.1 chromosome segregation protein SMC [Paenibacillus sp. PK3_47]
MIPWKMWFHGIRDYAPAYMDLSGREEHVLITGPNGAGKSTITYCMGAVLYSSKVDLDGLRSRNLAPDEPWIAQIRFLFKNEGRLRIDAPDYIEFSLHILQEPGQPVKREYTVASGDDPEHWETVTRYTSGDRQYNFTAYKKDLQYKYKIDPDLFYLIWYQQEVNQFAVMHPEERFRIFAEMHGIDQIQRNWEESMEKLKDTQEMMQSAEINVENKKQMVKIKRNDLERYEDNYRRLTEGGKQYVHALLQLEVYYRREQETLSGQIGQLELELEQQQDQLNEWKERETGLTGHLSNQEQAVTWRKEELENYEQQLQDLKSGMTHTQAKITELETELQQISKDRERIARSEAEVTEQLAEAITQLDEVNDEIARLHAENNQCGVLADHHRGMISRLEFVIEQERKQESIHQERLRQYVSSHHVQEELNRLDQQLQRFRDQRHDCLMRIQERKEELKRLEDNRDWSKRQMESLAFFHNKGIQAYPLRDLVELTAGAQLKTEEQFNTVKYTVFFDGHQAIPPNDLYHVPLRKVVPDRSVTELHALQLRVKEDLPEEAIPHAIKALWWVEQFFQAGNLRIDQGVLHDTAGIRGGQEQSRYILSRHAVLLHKEEVQKVIGSLTATLEELDHSIQQNTKRLQDLSSVIQLVREAEAFRTGGHERAERARKLEEERSGLSKQLARAVELREAESGLIKSQVELENRQLVLQAEAEFYHRLGQQKEKFEILGAAKRELRGQEIQQEELLQQQEACEEQLEKLEKTVRQLKRNVQELKDKQEHEARQIIQTTNQRDHAKDSFETAQGELVGTIREIEHFKQTAPAIYNEVTTSWAETQAASDGSSGGSGGRMSLSKLHTELDKGKSQYNNARSESGIDPAAPENYRVIEEEFQRLQDEYKRTEILFEQDLERTGQLKDQLETTINMRVLEILQRFKSYMSHFQFEGEIDWEHHEDRRGRTHFSLFIKARKEGHRGTMEDVSVKARGGRVGKGVSGGEESLSSLLFALALLQNLQTSPGFIVLDEFDSALDEQRKLKVFELYGRELQRKLIILTPKSHENSYLNRFSKSFIVYHDPTIPLSKVVGLVRKE